MDGSLKLNDYNILRNAAAGAHDPSMMYDPVSGKYYSYCTDVYGPPLGIENRIGIPVRSSDDLVHFTYEGVVLSESAIEQGRDNGEYPKTINFWAPFAEYVKGEYRLYYSATRAFGSSESRIWLATADSPLGPFENRGVVADTWGTDDTLPNAIDPHIIWEGERCWLVYGSFFGGIYIKELDPESGLSLDGDSRSLGKCISRKAEKPRVDGREGAAVIFVPQTGYYYLFQSYGWLGENYDIRVGRSRSVTGPYTDRSGRDLVEEAMGEKLAGSWRFEASAPCMGNDAPDWAWGGFFGPGHGVPFHDPVREEYFFVHHVRDGSPSNRTVDARDGRVSYRQHYMMIRPMYFIDGWPVFGPETFSGEPLNEQPPADQLSGCWELIFFDDKSNDQKHSQPYTLDETSEYIRRGIVRRSFDFENGQFSLTVTGVDAAGTAYWGKKKNS